MWLRDRSLTLIASVSCCCDSVNMAAALAGCTKEEQRAVIRFLWSKVCEGLKFIEGFQQNTGTVFYHVEVCMNGQRCLSGRTSVTHKEGAGYPSTSTTDEKIEQA
jgi:hypothetical protein